ncbi:right-handed parallel beta-helix repeat-containing protein [Geothermobacter ehrlichii]|uniref:right-handed parallel beta-helix repeat-containing protein n=1 Tax=Geothermobacter ehrlichii TaxID=213224 RepID=UPI00165320DE|nr:right-handed parallel beta-helix repeat-containing protein [Geothermobacter ehrlichii]
MHGDVVWQGRVDIAGDLVLAEDSRLTILPGTEVIFHSPAPGDDRWREHPNFTGSELIVRGVIDARGTAQAPIRFRPATRTIAPGSWGGINIGDSSEAVFAYCRFEGADSALHAQNSTVYVEQSVFRRNRIAVRFHSSEILIEHNRFERNGSGIRFHYGSPVICHNEFVDNGRSIFITAHPKEVHIEYNNFVSAVDYHLVLGEEVPEDVPAGRNWWGGTEPERIGELLFDRQRDPYLGRIEIQPLLKAPVDGAGPR